MKTEDQWGLVCGLWNPEPCCINHIALESSTVEFSGVWKAATFPLHPSFT